MTYSIKDIVVLRTLLWVDAVVGSGTAVIGLVFFASLPPILGLTQALILVISTITLLYSITAFMLLRQPSISIPALRVLVGANWLWAVVSVALLFFHFTTAEPFGKAFLIAQIVVVGGLAYLEGSQIIKNE